MTPMIQLGIRLLLITCALGALAFGQDEESLKEAVRSRAAKISEMVASGAVKEGPAGLLMPAEAIDAAQTQAMADENRDRLAVFKIIGKKSGLTPEEVAGLFVTRRAKFDRRSHRAGSRSLQASSRQDSRRAAVGAVPEARHDVLVE